MIFFFQLEGLGEFSRLSLVSQKSLKNNKMLYGIIDSMDMSLSKLWETVKDKETWRAAGHGVAKSRK